MEGINQNFHDMLKSSLLFQDVDAQVADFIGKTLKVIHFKKGEPIVLEGEVNDQVYFIKSGSVEIIKYQKELKQVYRVAILRPGNQFSEFSVLNRSNKTASAFALEDCELYQMDGDSFLFILQKVPAIGRKLASSLAQIIDTAMNNSFIEYFATASVAPSLEISSSVPPPIWKKFGIIPLSYQRGTLHVAAKDPTSKEFYEYCKSTLKPEQILMSLINDGDYDQTVRKLTVLHANPSSHLKKTLKQNDDKPLEVIEAMRLSPYFQGLAEAGLNQIIAHFEPMDFAPGDVIFKPGDPCDYFYLLQNGRVELSRPVNGYSGWGYLLAHDARHGFSDVSLLLGKPHSYMARATMPTRILRMHKDTFARLLPAGPFCLNLCRILAQQLQMINELSGLKFYDTSKQPEVAKLSYLVPKQMMQQHQILPLHLQDSEVTLGLVNPSDDGLTTVIGRYLRGFRVQLVLIKLEDFKRWLLEIPAPATVAATATGVKPKPDPNKTVEMLNKLLHEGFDSRASDLHLEPTADGYSVRFRIDGVLAETSTRIPDDMGESLINRIKIMSKLDITNHMTPQDGQLKILEGDLDLTARVATIPTKTGEGAVLRLVRSQGAAVPLPALVPEQRTIKILKNITKCKQGLFLVTGPTGSGKTTTLYSLIGELNRIDIKIISLEDPVELEIPGTMQIEMNDKQGLTFEKALRSSLRLDPDVMVVGEIRDNESAKIVFEAALSGHLVISTLHTNNAIAVKSRLKELGVPLGTMADGLIGAMAQRLVRALCKQCRELRPTTETEKGLFAERLHLHKPPQEIYHPRGCLLCNQTGYYGRLPLIEVWRKDRSMEDSIARDASLEDLMQWARASGFETLYEFGLKMVINGLTSLEEVDRMAGLG